MKVKNIKKCRWILKPESSPKLRWKDFWTSYKLVVQCRFRDQRLCVVSLVRSLAGICAKASVDSNIFELSSATQHSSSTIGRCSLSTVLRLTSRISNQKSDIALTQVLSSFSSMVLWDANHDITHYWTSSLDSGWETALSEGQIRWRQYVNGCSLWARKPMDW